MTFDGDPMKFVNWKMSFTILIDRKPLSASEKMIMYGNPFIIQKAFRDKLACWPKFSAIDPLALREFADFLQGFAEAIPHIKGLDTVDDSQENHKVLRKLPEWIVRK